MNPWTAYSDGSALPNPGRMGLGAIITAPDGTRHTLSLLAREVGCNNEAELRALVATLLALKSHGADMFIAHCDNSVVVEQITNPRAAPIARLAPLFDEVRTLFASFAEARLVWIPGHRNGEADGLARAALGMAPRAAVKKPRKRR